MLAGWRALGEARALRSSDWPGRLPGFFDLPPGPLAGPLRDLGARLVGRALPPRFAADAVSTVLALGPAHRGLALWLAAMGVIREITGAARFRLWRAKRSVA